MSATPRRGRASTAAGRSGARPQAGRVARFLRAIFALSAMAVAVSATESALVLQTDFGLKDGAVGAMRGVAVGVSATLSIHDLSHDNTPFDVWEAAYRLKQAAPFWPSGTVFVSVVDPGVGTARRSIVLQTKSGHLFVGPDNGTFTLVADELGIAGVREIDERRHRRAGSERSYTFHGRDIFAFVGARLAAGVVPFAEVGPELRAALVRLPYEPARREGNTLLGTIPALDFRYGNIWTNIDADLFAQLGPKPGESFRVSIRQAGREVFGGEMRYARTFGDVAEGAPLLYLNSLMNVAFALNQGDFAKKHGVGSGADWSVRVERPQP